MIPIVAITELFFFFFFLWAAVRSGGLWLFSDVQQQLCWRLQRSGGPTHGELQPDASGTVCQPYVCCPSHAKAKIHDRRRLGSTTSRGGDRKIRSSSKQNPQSTTEPAHVRCNERFQISTGAFSMFLYLLFAVALTEPC